MGFKGLWYINMFLFTYSVFIIGLINGFRLGMQELDQTGSQLGLPILLKFDGRKNSAPDSDSRGIFEQLITTLIVIRHASSNGTTTMTTTAAVNSPLQISP